jgi:hypothetical protein
VVSRTRLNTYMACLIFHTGGGDNTFLRNVGILILFFTVSIPRNVLLTWLFASYRISTTNTESAFPYSRSMMTQPCDV